MLPTPAKHRSTSQVFPYLDADHGGWADDANDAPGTSRSQQRNSGDIIACPGARVEVLVRIRIDVRLQQFDLTLVLALVDCDLKQTETPFILSQQVQLASKSLLEH